MSELKPLLESSPSAATRRLLRAGLPDNPRPDARRRAAIALGVGTTAAVTGASGSAAAGAGAVGVPLLSTASGANAGIAILAAKWLAGGLVVGSVVSGGATLVDDGLSSTAGVPSVTTPAAPPVHRAPAIAAPPNAAVVQTTPARVAELPEADQRPESRPAEVTRHAAAGSGRTTSQPVPVSGSTAIVSGRAPAEVELFPAAPPVPKSRLGREVALIDAARRAVAGGDADRAMSELDHYHAVRETQILDREARLLRIDALVLRGERARAAELAREYLRQLPNDPHSGRLLKLLEP